MDQVQGSRYFSKFDMKAGYNQLRIKPGQEWLTAFVTPFGTYQMNIMTFGFMNAPPVFQWFMNNFVYHKPKLVNNLVGYLDDANTHNHTLEEHIQMNLAFFEQCAQANITLNLDKCEFHKEKVDFLGVQLLLTGLKWNILRLTLYKNGNHHVMYEEYGSSLVSVISIDDLSRILWKLPTPYTTLPSSGPNGNGDHDKITHSTH